MKKTLYVIKDADGFYYNTATGSERSRRKATPFYHYLVAASVVTALGDGFHIFKRTVGP